MLSFSPIRVRPAWRWHPWDEKQRPTERFPKCRLVVTWLGDEIGVDCHGAVVAHALDELDKSDRVHCSKSIALCTTNKLLTSSQDRGRLTRKCSSL